MTYEFWISYRYLTAKKDRFLSVINLVSVVGVAIGVMALIVVIAVMSGFDRDLREKIIGTNAHILIEKESGVKDYDGLRQTLTAMPGVTGASGFIHGNVFLESGQRAYGLILRGVDPLHEAEVTKVNDYLEADLRVEDIGLGEVFIGHHLATYHGLRSGDEITVLAPASGVAGEGWRYTLKIAGIFTSGMYDYDMNLILVHIRQAQRIFNLPEDTASGIAVNVQDVYAVDEVKEAIYDEIGFSYIVRTWIENNSSFFAALQLEKYAMFVILTLIVLVASFNIISTLIVTVTSKVKDIGILKSVGVPRRSIRKIFTIQGLSLGLTGTFWGLVGGFGLCYILQETNLIKLPQEVYYIDHLPVLLKLSDVLMIVGAAILITYLATIYPAAKAAGMQPVDALRYE